MTIEYSGGVRPQNTTTTYERKYGQLSQPGQRIQPGKITIPKDRVNDFIRAMKYAGYGHVVRSYGATESGQPTQKVQQLMGMIDEKQFAREKEELARYKINGKPVLKSQFEQKKAEARQTIGNQWQSQKVTHPQYFISQESREGKIQSMPVSKEVYNKYLADIEFEGKKYQKFETQQRTGYTSSGARVKIQGVGTKEKASGILGTWQTIEEKARAVTRKHLPSTESIFIPYAERRKR